MHFEKWCKSVKVKTLEDLRQIVLLEHFFWSVPENLRSKLVEKGFKKLKEVARFADELAASSKRWNETKGGSESSKDLVNYDSGSNYGSRKGDWNGSGRVEQLGKQPYYNRNQGWGNPVNVRYEANQERPPVRCYACGEVGHISSKCPLNKFVGLTVNCGVKCSERVERMKEVVKVPFNVSSFITEGKVSVDGGNDINVVILRDTGCSQSLVARDVMESLEHSYSGEDAKIIGVGGKKVIPLHYINLRSGFVTGRVKVGICEDIPIFGVHMLLGNDLAGDKVIPEPQIVEDPLKDNADVCGAADAEVKIFVPCENEVSGAGIRVEHIEVYPACAVTRARSKSSENRPLAEEKDSSVKETSKKIIEKDGCTGRLEMNINKYPDFTVGKCDFIKAQREDSSLIKCWDRAGTVDEVNQQPILVSFTYYKLPTLIRIFHAGSDTPTPRNDHRCSPHLYKIHPSLASLPRAFLPKPLCYRVHPVASPAIRPRVSPCTRLQPTARPHRHLTYTYDTPTCSSLRTYEPTPTHSMLLVATSRRPTLCLRAHLYMLFCNALTVPCNTNPRTSPLLRFLTTLPHLVLQSTHCLCNATRQRMCSTPRTSPTKPTTTCSP
ncbi:hypothetical protein Pcinc_010622 [Petrolisthes cinctipes]|uniref:CCHC-type domain-containing protein n=1 Tax=Petrolisthes cinctipes TaxID=88211 RepID=A0AAE1G4H6_PETCI|nr:hypothetical protein Pcinc_010622 [Petrolisthes cinctipes]